MAVLDAAKLAVMDSARNVFGNIRQSEAWRRHRDFIARVVAQYNGVNPRVFGSAARGDDTVQSDLDLLIDPTDATTLNDIAAIRETLQDVLGVRVDLFTPNSLKDRVRERVLLSAVPL